MAAIADASPLIALARVNGLDCTNRDVSVRLHAAAECAHVRAAWSTNTTSSPLWISQITQQSASWIGLGCSLLQPETYESFPPVGRVVIRGNGE